MELLQQSVARQTWVRVWPQPALLVVVNSGVITRLVQHAPAGVGGSNVHGVPQRTALFVAQLMSEGVTSRGEPKIAPEKSLNPPELLSCVRVRAGMNWNVRSTLAVPEAMSDWRSRLPPE